MPVSTAEAPRITRLRVAAPFSLLITWHDRSTTRHDLAELVATNAWAAALRDPDVFATAAIRDDGWRIEWPGTDIDFSADGLWDDATASRPAARWMSAADFAGWMKEMELSFAGAAEALDTSPRMLKYYAAGTHEIPKTVWLACMHLAAEKSRGAA
jgi:hypothetical protein